MGQVKSLAGMTEDMLEEYVQLTYLSRTEIVNLLKIFLKLGPDQMKANFHHRFTYIEIKEKFPQLKFNPFRDRIYGVFSSERDNCFSFEDMLDLCSVMSENCPDKVKATWAFRIFDFDEDGAIGESDLMTAIDRLTQGTDETRAIKSEHKEEIAHVLLKEMDIEGNGCVGQLEFEHAVGKMMDFPLAFSFRI